MKKGIRTAALILGGLLIYTRAFSKSSDLDVSYIVKDLPKHPTKKYNKRDESVISKVIIHHSASTLGSPYQYAQWHIDEHNWPGIGYHFVIQKDGTIFQTNDLDTLSYHALNCNQVGVGICLTGNFMIEMPTGEQYEKLAILIRHLNDLTGRRLDIAGHHSCKNTDCPGVNMDIQYVRDLVYGIGDVSKLDQNDNRYLLG